MAPGSKKPAGAAATEFDLDKDFDSLVGKNYWDNSELWKRAHASGRMDEVIAKFEALVVNRLGDACLATPAISDGMIFVRTQHYVFGIGRKAPAKE